MLSQELVNKAVMGLMRGERIWLDVLVIRKNLINVRCSLGFTALFATCYSFWLEGTALLLELGANPGDVGLGCTALGAVAFGLRDSAERGASESALLVTDHIVELLQRRGVDAPHREEAAKLIRIAA